MNAVWLHDHLVTPEELRQLGSPNFYEPLVTMAALAAVRPHLTIGVATVILPLRDPVLLAKQIGTLGGFFPGRLIIGLGAGRYASEFDALGIDYFGRRGKVSAEYLRLIRALLTEHAVTFEGELRSLREASMYPQPSETERPRIWYAGNSDVAARRAARLADGWIGASMPPDELKRIVAMMHEVRRADGLPGLFDIAYSATVERRDASTPEANVSEDLHVHAATIAGDSTQVGDQLAEYLDAGVTHFQLSLRAASLGDLLANLDWLAEEVIARQRSAGSRRGSPAH